MKLQSKYFDKIKQGEKIYEIRLNDEKRKLINIDDTIIFKKEPDYTENIFCKVTDLIHFNSFNSMIDALPPTFVGFENLTINEIVNIYHEFYSPCDEIKYGVLAIKVEIINQ